MLILLHNKNEDRIMIRTKMQCMSIEGLKSASKTCPRLLNYRNNPSTPNNIRQHLQIQCLGQKSASKLSSSCLSTAKLQLHVVQESWQEPSFHFSIRAAVLWFGFSGNGSSAVALLSTAAHSQCIPCSLQNMIPSELGAKASTVVSFYRRHINSLPTATDSTVSSSWKTILVLFRKGS